MPLTYKILFRAKIMKWRYNSLTNGVILRFEAQLRASLVLSAKYLFIEEDVPVY